MSASRFLSFATQIVNEFIDTGAQNSARDSSARYSITTSRTSLQSRVHRMRDSLCAAFGHQPSGLAKSNSAMSTPSLNRGRSSSASIECSGFRFQRTRMSCEVEVPNLKRPNSTERIRSFQPRRVPYTIYGTYCNREKRSTGI